jgi:hypothetical protein
MCTARVQQIMQIRPSPVDDVRPRLLSCTQTICHARVRRWLLRARAWSRQPPTVNCPALAVCTSQVRRCAVSILTVPEDRSMGRNEAGETAACFQPPATVLATKAQLAAKCMKCKLPNSTGCASRQGVACLSDGANVLPPSCHGATALLPPRCRCRAGAWLTAVHSSSI